MTVVVLFFAGIMILSNSAFADSGEVEVFSLERAQILNGRLIDQQLVGSDTSRSVDPFNRSSRDVITDSSFGGGDGLAAPIVFTRDAVVFARDSTDSSSSLYEAAQRIVEYAAQRTASDEVEGIIEFRQLDLDDLSGTEASGSIGFVGVEFESIVYSCTFYLLRGGEFDEPVLVCEVLRVGCIVILENEILYCSSRDLNRENQQPLLFVNPGVLRSQVPWEGDNIFPLPDDEVPPTYDPQDSP